MSSLAPVTPDTPGFTALLTESLTEGHRMLARFEQNWRSGENRFAREGEIMLGAFKGTELVGICGLNIDPYDPGPRAGRIRHLYVLHHHRQNGFGRLLLEEITSLANEHFDYLNTHAPPLAFEFYRRLGFEPLSGIENITHRLMR